MSFHEKSQIARLDQVSHRVRWVLCRPDAFWNIGALSPAVLEPTSWTIAPDVLPCDSPSPVEYSSVVIPPS